MGHGTSTSGVQTTIVISTSLSPLAIGMSNVTPRLLSPIRRTLLIGQVDGGPAQESPWVALFERGGFAATSQGLFARWAGGEG